MNSGYSDYFVKRVVGGLLSAYDVSGDKVDIADRLLPTWDTPLGIPHSIIILAHGRPQILDGLGYILCSSHHRCQATALLVQGTSHSSFLFSFNFLAVVPVVFLFVLVHE